MVQGIFTPGEKPWIAKAGLLCHNLWPLIMLVDELQDMGDLFLLSVVGSLLCKSRLLHRLHIGVVVALPRQWNVQ